MGLEIAIALLLEYLLVHQAVAVPDIQRTEERSSEGNEELVVDEAEAGGSVLALAGSVHSGNSEGRRFERHPQIPSSFRTYI